MADERAVFAMKMKGFLENVVLDPMPVIHSDDVFWNGLVWFEFCSVEHGYVF
jgi:hypothetical protein